MFNANSWDDRNNTGISSEQYKAQYYSTADWAKLFVESSDYQARVIHQLTNKAVLSVEGNCLYSQNNFENIANEKNRVFLYVHD